MKVTLLLFALIALSAAQQPADGQSSSSTTASAGTTRDVESTTSPTASSARKRRQAHYGNNNYDRSTYVHPNYEHGNTDYERGYLHGYNRAKHEFEARHGTHHAAPAAAAPHHKTYHAVPQEPAPALAHRKYNKNYDDQYRQY